MQRCILSEVEQGVTLLFGISFLYVLSYRHCFLKLELGLHIVVRIAEHGCDHVRRPGLHLAVTVAEFACDDASKKTLKL